MHIWLPLTCAARCLVQSCPGLSASMQKGAPLRKGKLLQSSSFGVPTAVPTLAGTPPNRGMVLPVPVFVGGAGGVEIGASPDRSSASAAAAGLANSLSLAAIDDAHRPESLAHPLVVGPAGSNAGTRSPLDLLSGLDCNFDAAALPVLGGASASSANPFAPAVSVAHPLPGSSNPFGEHAAPGSAAHVAHPNLVGSMSDDFFASAGSLLPPFAAADSLVSPQGPGRRVADMAIWDRGHATCPLMMTSLLLLAQAYDLPWSAMSSQQPHCTTHLHPCAWDDLALA